MMAVRTVEKKIGDNWINIFGIDNLTKGDTFRMFEPDGEPVIDDNGVTEWIAKSDPYWSDTFDTWMIDIWTTQIH